jgi:hypothetical protein
MGMHEMDVHQSQDLIKSELMFDIDSKIREFSLSSEIDGIKALEKYDPQKAAKILFLSASGKTQTQLVKKYGFKRDTIVRVLATYADHLGKVERAWWPVGFLLLLEH